MVYDQHGSEKFDCPPFLTIYRIHKGERNGQGFISADLPKRKVTILLTTSPEVKVVMCCTDMDCEGT